MERIFTRLVDLPLTIRGYTSLDPDGNYNIYLNSRLSLEQQRKTYKHELTHIQRDDFADFKTLAEAESF
ncbi:MAG: ImmA/IrrE family metallo-endopeptidase [Clostridia bacterium]|nr:ImmA/IrrE family metallo-endopeptidase [Clostridia bacterium]